VNRSRTLYLRTAALALAAIAAACRGEAAEDRRPNVLFLITDQHNWRALGCAGNDEIRTPNLDRLAASGIRFENAFCQTAQCRPSRFTIWNGRYARSHGLATNATPEDPPDPTMAELFRASGYRTASIGKHHMNKERASDRGFDEVIDLIDYAEFFGESFVPLEESELTGLRRTDLAGINPLDPELHPTGFWTSRTVDFLRETDEPFFLWCSFFRPHSPIDPTRPWAAQYDPADLTLPPSAHYEFDTDVPGLRWVHEKNGTPFDEAENRKTLALYYAAVSEVDHGIGTILDELERLGLADDTIVVFTSDHGEMMSAHGAWTKGQQGYDDTLRVPLIVRPLESEAGAVRSELVGLIDLLPTLIEWCGLEAPPGLQGRSLAGLLSGRDADWRDTIFNEFGNPYAEHTRTARTLTSKYVAYGEADVVTYEQFFDLAQDPWEMHNAVADPRHANEVAALRAALAQWDRETERAPGLK